MLWLGLRHCSGKILGCFGLVRDASVRVMERFGSSSGVVCQDFEMSWFGFGFGFVKTL